MKRALFVLCMVFLLTGCRIGELSLEEKQKISDLKAEIAKIESEISVAEKEYAKGATGLIPVLQEARITVDQLTVAIMRQHIAAIESGGKVTISTAISVPDQGIVSALDSEIKTADIELHKTKAESSLYAGGLIKVTIEARAAMQELTLASLKQKQLAAKYGLFLPAPPSEALATKKTAPPYPQTASERQPVIEQAKVEDPGPFDFRRVRWGMNKNDVKQREDGAPVEEGNDIVVYKDEILGHKASLVYTFVGDKLYSATYLVDGGQYSNKNRYVDAYDEIVLSLTEKYGEPKTKNTFWSNDLYKNDYQDRGMAYAIGHVTSRVGWETDSMEIKAVLTGNNHKINSGIIYENKELAKEATSIKNQRQSSKL